MWRCKGYLNTCNNPFYSPMRVTASFLSDKPNLYQLWFQLLYMVLLSIPTKLCSFPYLSRNPLESPWTTMSPLVQPRFGLLVATTLRVASTRQSKNTPAGWAHGYHSLPWVSLHNRPDDPNRIEDGGIKEQDRDGGEDKMSQRRWRKCLFDRKPMTREPDPNKVQISR